MSSSLDKITIKGFKSIKALDDFALNKLNVFIGANGAGKSNFIEVFRMLRAALELNLPNLQNANLQSYFTAGGGFRDYLYNGTGENNNISVELMFGENGYKLELSQTANSSVMIQDEERYWSGSGWKVLGGGHVRPNIVVMKENSGYQSSVCAEKYVYDAISGWYIYHFHDTSQHAPMKRAEIVQDKNYLRFDASNIAPFLLNLKRCRDGEQIYLWTYRSNEYIHLQAGDFAYNRIVETIKLVTPFFDDFILEPVEVGPKTTVNLSWKQNGSDYPMQPYHFSDGTLRFICLVVALLQPSPPSTLIIDEPELGLHPYAVGILAELIKAAAERTQVIVSTQSAALLDCFAPEDVVIVNREKGESVFKRLEQGELDNWLKDYSLGELWSKNVINGGPSHE